MDRVPIHPIIVGVGQTTIREEEPGNAKHPLQLVEMAIRACVEDAGCPEILNRVDILSIVNIVSWKYEDPAALLGEMLGIKPGMAEYTTIGGNTPQWLVNRAAKKIAAGEIEIALLCGGEAMHSASTARKTGSILPWPDPKGFPAMVGDGRSGSSPHELNHKANLPVNIYPLFENALRAERGLGIEEHKKFLCELCAGFTKIAAKNPLAWFREEKSPHRIGAVSSDNRMIGFPYTKFMNPIIDVNQAAAIILTSNVAAERLSIPRDKWVYIHAGYDANDKWFVSDRVSYIFSPAIKELADAALERAGVNADDIDFFDIYSCFPCATIIGAKSMGLNIDNLPPLTITGGLPYFGGPGNNYTMHAIAHAAERLRRNPKEIGYISALGWYSTKHAAGIYSGREPARPWNNEEVIDIQQRIDRMPGPELNTRPNGTATVETYTVVHDRDGNPDYTIVIARLEDGKRCWAQTERDVGLMKQMETEETIGKKGFVTSRDNAANTIRFFD